MSLVLCESNGFLLSLPLSLSTSFDDALVCCLSAKVKGFCGKLVALP